MKETAPLLEDGQPSNDHVPSTFTQMREGAVITNTGSTARDHLANERTYLAWMRTALALIGASLALLKWDAFSMMTGYLVAVVGVAILIISTKRYFRVMMLLEQGLFEPNVLGVVCTVSVVVAAIVSTFVLHFINHL